MAGHFKLRRHNTESVDWNDDDKEKAINTEPEAKYNLVSNKIRQSIPEHTICAYFCGGKKCRYCLPSINFPNCEMAIDGLYSAWVTENILAMSRPSTPNITEFKIIDQFIECGIRSVINTQRPGEHASCGHPLEEEGFSYRPQHFMDNNIFFYNFGWKDFGVASLSTILDMVRVMQFALSEGKVAVHCHAGLGRTGVMIACYLVFNNRISGREAVHYVRSKRKNSLQTTEQVGCVIEFDTFLIPFRLVFALASDGSAAFNINEYLRRQKAILHGFEGRKLRYIPKIIYVCVERLLDLANNRKFSDEIHDHGEGLENLKREAPLAFDKGNLSPNISDNAEAPVWVECSAKNADLEDQEEDDEISDKLALNPNCGSSFKRGSNEDTRSNIARAFTQELSDQEQQEINKIKNDLNSCDDSWIQIRSSVDNVKVLVYLILEWLHHLKSPVLRPQDINILCICEDDPTVNLKKLEKTVCGTINYLVHFIVSLQPLSDDLDESMLLSFLAALTHQQVSLGPPAIGSDKSTSSVRSDSFIPGVQNSIRRLPVMKPDVVEPLVKFFYSLIDQKEAEHLPLTLQQTLSMPT